MFQFILSHCLNIASEYAGLTNTSKAYQEQINRRKKYINKSVGGRYYTLT